MNFHIGHVGVQETPLFVVEEIWSLTVMILLWLFFQLDGHKANDRFSLSVSISYKMNRIFVGSIPKTKQKEQIMEEFGKATGKVLDDMFKPRTMLAFQA